MSERRVTIRQVAAEAGVGLGTVSRVLNGAADVSDCTRQKVEATVQRLGYRPSLRARSLRQSRSMAVAAIVPELVNPVLMEFLRGVERTAEERGYVVLIGETHRSAARESRLVERLVDEGIDGVVLGGPLVARDAELLRDHNVPVVPGAEEAGSTAYSAAMERAQAAATRRMVRRLLELGHRSFVLVIGTLPRWAVIEQYRRARTGAIRTELRRAEAKLEVLSVDMSRVFESCREQLGAHMAGPDHATAVISYSHVLAPGVLSALQRCGVHIPADASFVTFGDSDWAMAHQPALTVVRHDLFAEATWLTARLLDHVEGREEDLVPPAVEAELVERESCGPAPGTRVASSTGSSARRGAP